MIIRSQFIDRKKKLDSIKRSALLCDIYMDLHGYLCVFPSLDSMVDVVVVDFVKMILLVLFFSFFFYIFYFVETTHIILINNSLFYFIFVSFSLFLCCVLCILIFHVHIESARNHFHFNIDFCLHISFAYHKLIFNFSTAL